MARDTLLADLVLFSIGAGTMMALSVVILLTQHFDKRHNTVSAAH